ncbi:MAG: hypothetical protein AAGG08_20510, partial [Actinomycetota bacterium]
GVLIAVVSPSTALALDALTFLFAAAVQRTIGSDFRRGAPGDRGVVDQLRTAWRFLREEVAALTLIIAGFLNSIAIGIVLGLLVPWAIEDLGYATDDVRVGVLHAMIGVGGLVAAAVFSRVFTMGRVRWLTPTTLLWSAMFVAAMSFVTASLAPVVVAAFAAGIMLTIQIGITYRQLVTPDQLVSTVNTLGRMIAAGGQPVGAAFGAVLATRCSIDTAQIAAAVVLLVTSVATASVLARPGVVTERPAPSR